VTPSRPTRGDAGALLSYLLLAAWLSHGLWPHPAVRVLSLNPVDQNLEEWFLAHGALLWRGDFGLVTDRMNAPDGINLMANASMMLHGVLLGPVTLTLGAAVSFALLVAGNLAATAIGWYLLFSRTLGAHRLAAFLGGLLCGFAPGMISQSLAHLHVAAGWLAPAIVWCVIRLYRGCRPVRTGLLLAALVVAQLFAGEEVLFLSALALAIFVVVYAASDRPGASAAARPFLTGLGVATLAAGALLAYPLWIQFTGPQSVPNGPFSPSIFATDLASVAAFSPLSLAGSPSAVRLATGPSELNTFFGWPLLLVAVACAIWLWRRPAVTAAAATIVVMLWLSLGPKVQSHGDKTGLPALYGLLDSFPVIDGALPSRFALAAVPAIAALLVFATDRALLLGRMLREQRSKRQARRVRAGRQAGWPPRPVIGWIVPAAVAVALLPIMPTPLPTASRAPVPQFIAGGHWRDCVRPGGVLVPVPLPDPTDAETLSWAATANAEFGVPEGTFIAPYGSRGRASVGVHPQPTSRLLAKVEQTGKVPAVTDGLRAQARSDASYWRASCVVLASGKAAVTHADALRRSLDALYGPSRHIVDAWVWRT
jgi:hypothetical protein